MLKEKKKSKKKKKKEKTEFCLKERKCRIEKY